MPSQPGNPKEPSEQHTVQGRAPWPLAHSYWRREKQDLEFFKGSGILSYLLSPLHEAPCPKCSDFSDTPEVMGLSCWPAGFLWAPSLHYAHKSQPYLSMHTDIHCQPWILSCTCLNWRPTSGAHRHGVRHQSDQGF